MLTCKVRRFETGCLLTAQPQKHGVLLRPGVFDFPAVPATPSKPWPASEIPKSLAIWVIGVSLLRAIAGNIVAELFRISTLREYTSDEVRESKHLILLACSESRKVSTARAKFRGRAFLLDPPT